MSDCMTAGEDMTVSVGLDVHKHSVRLAAVQGDRLLLERTLPYDLAGVENVIGQWPLVRCCYEAGPTGFGLYRHLKDAGVECVVVAPGLVPQRPSERIKTDSRDARKLASMFAGGLLTPVFVPSVATEAVRDLVRARDDARLDRMRTRHRLSGFLLRHDRRMPTTFWGKTRRIWLGQQNFDLLARQHAFDDYLHALDLADSRIERLDEQIRTVAEQEPYRETIARLRCLRGVDTLTALGLVAEIGDFNRFKNAREFMSYVGLVPSERSSGENRRQGAITKVGSAHARRLLVEAAWTQARKPKISSDLKLRQQGQPAALVERSWSAQQRLHKRWQRMNARGKPSQKTAVAVARELAGFIWAITTDQPLRLRTD